MDRLLLSIKAFCLVAALGFPIFFSQPVLAACTATEQQVSWNFDGSARKDLDAAGNEIYCFPIDRTGDISANPIIKILKIILQFIVAGVGLAVVGGIIFGGFTYMTARANTGQIQKGEEIIRSAIIGLLLYIFAFALLNWLVPGGILT